MGLEIPAGAAAGLLISLLIGAGIVSILWVRRRQKSFVPRHHSKEQTEEFDRLLKPFGLAYDPAEDIFYTRKDAWQKKCGYQEKFVEAAPLCSMILDCEPVFFHYDNRNWLIEFRKGQYGLASGAEIGIYVDNNQDGHYESVNEEEELYFGMRLFCRRGEVAQSRGRHWKLGAFALGEFHRPGDLYLLAELTFPDIFMRGAFLKAARVMGYSNERLYVKQNSVGLLFIRPQSIQPALRKSPGSRFRMGRNRRLCRAYQRITRKQEDTLDKLEYFSLAAPRMYQSVLHMLKAWEYLHE